MKRPNKPKNKQYSSNLVYNYFAAERIFEAKIEAVEVIRLCVEAKIHKIQKIRISSYFDFMHLLQYLLPELPTLP